MKIRRGSGNSNGNFYKKTSRRARDRRMTLSYEAIKDRVVEVPLEVKASLGFKSNGREKL